MNLDILAGIPDDEKSVLLVGEYHRNPMFGKTLNLLQAFEPDGIGIEMRPDVGDYHLVRWILDHCQPKKSPLIPDDIAGYSGFPSVMHETLVYACLQGIPLYFLDWQPCSPDEILDVKQCIDNPIPDYDELGKGFFESILATFPDVALKKLALQAEEVIDEQAYVKLLGSDEGMALRNEWTAMALNAKKENRFLYVAGLGHLCDRDVERYTPLQLLVDAPHRYIVKMDPPYSTDGTIERVDDTSEFVLPWDTLDYMKVST